MIKRILISIIVISSLFFVILKCNKNKFTVNEMHICYVLDDGYTEPTLVSISSLIRHAKKGNKIALHIVDTGISEEGKEKFRKLVNAYNKNNRSVPVTLEIVQYDISIFDNISQKKWGRNIFVKFVLQDIFPSLDKIIYLDGDMIIAGSLSELWNIDLKDNYWAGIVHAMKQTHCVGTMLINLKAFRQDDMAKKLIEKTLDGQEKLKQEKSQKKITEEYALNTLCKSKDKTINRILTLPFRYNMHLGYTIKNRKYINDEIKQQILSEIPNIIVYHYSSKNKPWKISWHEFAKRINPTYYDLWHEEAAICREILK
ncbi:MAG: hypothetical protein IJ481_00160 [Alphaproteobacteria bacterium]|nr:hypothetical protein [Alphaproteobacteria bacterium]